MMKNHMVKPLRDWAKKLHKEHGTIHPYVGISNCCNFSADELEKQDARITELEAQLITTNTALILSYQGRNVPSNIRDIIEENRVIVKQEAHANHA